MKVVVVGGTGFNGRRIVAHLLEHGHSVCVVARGELPAAQKGRVEQIRVDRRDAAAFSAAFSSSFFDAVIDNIAYEPEDARISLNAFGTRVGQYLYTSTMAVYHDLLHRLDPATEGDADLTYRPGPSEGLESALHPTKGHAYANGKREVEQIFATASVPWTALRPSQIVGPDDWVGGIWWWVQRLSDGGPILVPRIGTGHVFQITYVEDLADAFVAALGNPKASQRAYNIAGPELLSADTWSGLLAHPLGRVAKCVQVPPEVISAAGLTEYRLPVAGLPFGHVLMDITSARQDLGFQPTASAIWADDTARGCFEHPPSADSRHYEHRAREVALATAYSCKIATADRELANTFSSA